MVNGLSDVFSQLSGHFQSVDEVWGRSQDGVVGHEVRGSDRRVVGIKVDCCAVGCVATVVALQGGERGKNYKMKRQPAYGETTVEKNTRNSGECTQCVFKIFQQSYQITLFHTWCLDYRRETWAESA